MGFRVWEVGEPEACPKPSLTLTSNPNRHLYRFFIHRLSCVIFSNLLIILANFVICLSIAIVVRSLRFRLFLLSSFLLWCFLLFIVVIFLFIVAVIFLCALLLLCFVFLAFVRRDLWVGDRVRVRVWVGDS